MENVENIPQNGHGTAADVAEYGLEEDQIQIVKSPRDLKREVILREKAGSGPYDEQLVDYRLPGRVGKA